MVARGPYLPKHPDDPPRRKRRLPAPGAAFVEARARGNQLHGTGVFRPLPRQAGMTPSTKPRDDVLVSVEPWTCAVCEGHIRVGTLIRPWPSGAQTTFAHKECCHGETELEPADEGAREAAP